MELKGNICIVAAHPDDEVFGMGGSIAKFSQSGSSISVIFMCDGVTARTNIRESIESRRNSAIRALTILGVSDVTFGDFPDNQLDKFSRLEVIKWIEGKLDKFEPDFIFTHYINDLNIDHRITAEATLVATRPKSSSSIKGVFHFEVPSSTGWFFGHRVFTPQLFIDVSSVNQKKELALQEYEIEIEQFPNARSFHALQANSTLRGSQVSIPSAEAFEISYLRDVLSRKGEGQEVEVTNLRLSDSNFLMELRNSNIDLRFFPSQKPVTSSEHKKWIDSRILNSDSLTLVARIDEKPVGILYTDLNNSDEEIISISVRSDCRNFGIASMLMRKLFQELNGREKKTLLAIIHEDNLPSIKLFTKFLFYKLEKIDQKFISYKRDL
jgi:LmbE family N-acetylglucosaminyl deacetylase